MANAASNTYRLDCQLAAPAERVQVIDEAAATLEYFVAWLEQQWVEADELLDKTFDHIPENTGSTAETPAIPVSNQQFK